MTEGVLIGFAISFFANPLPVLHAAPAGRAYIPRHPKSMQILRLRHRIQIESYPTMDGVLVLFSNAQRPLKSMQMLHLRHKLNFGHQAILKKKNKITVFKKFETSVD